MIRKAKKDDFEQIWRFFEEIVSKGTTYGFDQKTKKDKAYKLWIEIPRESYVFEEKGRILGSYYIKNNFGGPGNHVCNCGYMVDRNTRNKGIGSALCQHSIQNAKKMGYKAMQFNYVASSNSKAIKLWEKYGFKIVGRLPKAFHHPEKGYIDALVMYQWL